jgi:hypothetical protein
MAFSVTSVCMPGQQEAMACQFSGAFPTCFNEFPQNPLNNRLIPHQFIY